MEEYKTIHENNVLINPPKKTLTIKTQTWSRNCDDGCCHTYGTDIFINGKRVSQGDYHSIEIILKDVLESFGFECELA